MLPSLLLLPLLPVQHLSLECPLKIQDELNYDTLVSQTPILSHTHIQTVLCVLSSILSTFTPKENNKSLILNNVD